MVDRFRLLFGPYSTPPIRLGQVVADEVRDRDVIVVGISDGHIAWPVGRPRGERGRSLIVCGALAEAVRRESNQAVCYWWGVTPQTVSKWRKLLGVGATTDGTSRLRSEYCHEPVMDEARKKAWAKAKDPVRREKIAAAKRGRRRPRSVIRKMIQAKTGTKASDETRRKMSDSHKARGTRPPKAERAWTAEEDDAVKTMSPIKAAMRCRRTLQAIYSRRSVLGIRDGNEARWQSARRS